MRNLYALGLTLLASAAAVANDVPEGIDFNLGMTPDPEKGLWLILNEPMGAPVMKAKDVPRLWQVWEPEERAKAETASEDERRAMTWARYGWADRPDGDRWVPLDYTPDGAGNLVTNCFACHGGQLMGKTVPGIGNTLFDLTALATDVARLRTLDSGGDPARVPEAMAPFKTPLNHHRGVSNAVIFAPVFAALRTPSLAMEYTRNPEKLTHHDMNAPAWWLYQHKERIYADAFAPKTPRQLMPFAMSPMYDDAKFQSFEPNFVHIQAYIESLEPPRYPFPIDQVRAERGRILFNKECSSCHGRYGEDRWYPTKRVPLDEIGTDPIRLTSISRERREAANAGWLQYNGAMLLDLEAEGYVGQHLAGIWATAPYLHNGSIPTLYHLFNVDERPTVWKRDATGYDPEKVGLVIETFDTMPEGLSPRERRMHYDTSHSGNSAAGHTFPDDVLNDEEKRAVIEYLKTL